MQRARRSSNHPEFGKFITSKLTTLGLSRESFRDTCHMKQAYLEDIKKG